jgi:hypothetical protein
MGNTKVQSREPPKGVTFEEVWALMQETDRRMQETDRRMKETDRLIKENAQRIKETDRQMKETDRRMKETDRLVKETERQIGKLGNRLGDVIENLMSPKLHKKFKKLGFVFTRNSRNVEIDDREHQPLAEIDVLLENGEYAMAVEVKTRLTIENIQEHLERMEVLRRAADERNDRRKYLGAVAGASLDRNVLAYALKKGLYVIIPSAETVDIEAPPTPACW